jgi:hypothetical protein
LIELARNGDFLYFYDSLASTDSRVKNWTEHRNLVTNMIKRSRYFIGFSPASLAGSKAGKVAGEQVLTACLFEGAAGGSIILGSAPRCLEFDECFDWPDAVIEISPDGSDVVSVINELDANPDWTERMRRTNAVKCLLKHDWVYRWEHILSTVGMQPLPQLKERKSRLSIMASAAVENIDPDGIAGASNQWGLSLGVPCDSVSVQGAAGIGASVPGRAGPDPRAAMACHLDVPGASKSLNRSAQIAPE